MLGAYDSLMRSGGGMQNAMQATPVHHVGKGTPDQPQRGSIKDEAMGFLSEVEGELGKYRPGSHAYNQLLHMRGQMIQGLTDMDIEHQQLNEGANAVAPLDQKTQDVIGRMGPYMRGITPQGKPVR